MARNEELLANLKYVCGIMEQFAELAAECKKLEPVSLYSSIDSYRIDKVKDKDTYAMLHAALFGSGFDPDKDKTFEEWFRESEGWHRRPIPGVAELYPPAPRYPEKPGKPAILFEDEPSPFQVAKRRAYETARRDYEERLAAYRRTRAKIGALYEEQRKIADKKAGPLLEAHKRRRREEWERMRQEKLDRAREERESSEQENRQIARSNEAKMRQCQNNVAEMRRLQCMFESATSSGWYPPAFRTLDAVWGRGRFAHTK